MEKLTQQDLDALVKVAALMRKQLNAHDTLIQDENFDVRELFTMFIFPEVKEQDRVEDFLSAVETITEWQNTSDYCYGFLEEAIAQSRLNPNPKPKLTLVSSKD